MVKITTELDLTEEHRRVLFDINRHNEPKPAPIPSIVWAERVKELHAHGLVNVSRNGFCIKYTLTDAGSSALSKF